MKNVYRFKILQFRNGLGEDVFRVKEQCLFTFYLYHTYDIHPYDIPMEFDTREESLKHIEAYMDKVRKKRAEAIHAKKANKLTFIIEEKIEHKL